MKKTKFLVITVCLLISMSDANSQDIKLSKNSLYFELLGNGGFYSINYERQVSSKLYGRIGFSTLQTTNTQYFGGEETKTRTTTFPVLMTYLSGNGKNHLEIAGGMLFGLVTETNVSSAIIDLTAFIGYRYQPPGGGFIFRIGFSPFLSLDKDADFPDQGFTPSAGISFGYHF
jgi:hypothetical protein